MRSSAGNKQTHIKASMTSETTGVGGEGARIQMSYGTGPETQVEAEEVRPDVNWASDGSCWERLLMMQLGWQCAGLSNLSAGEGGLEHGAELLENKLEL